MSRKSIILLGLSAVVTAAAAGWVLITPDNPLTDFFRRKISDVDARIVIGPYPGEEDFRLLKQHKVGLIVSLLNPAIPYEGTLLEREQALAAKYQIPLKSFPMSSILGQKFGNEYDTSAERAATAIASSPEKVYLHCYLGLHRIQSVRNLLAARGVQAGTYSVRAGERDKASSLTDMAEAAYNNRQYQAALDALAKIDENQLTGNARILRAWSYYRIGNVPQAHALFQSLLSVDPGSAQAAIGLGYCAYRQNDYATAEQQFQAALRSLPDDADALGGLGLTYYRADRLDEAAAKLEAALKLTPDNQELRDILERVRAKR
ncbi:MAG: tetratricopeptide repeat protein [Acidobacteria bacterium]|nr:tetratricopeptide repeat protein [Acidobacteriota bacterium]